MSDIKVVVTPFQSTLVRVSQNSQPRVNSISYGTKTLLSSTDLLLNNLIDGSVITYNAANNNFFLQPANNLFTNFNFIFDGGTY
jgi:hypothetical protein